MKNNLITVSYSGVSSYDGCPRQFKYRYVDKVEVVKPPPSPAMERGLEIHESIEDVINGKAHTVHKDVMFYNDYVKTIRDMGAVAEASFNFDDQWNPRAFENKDGKGIRGLIDAHTPVTPTKMTVQEWKTGKKYDEHSKQRDLYGMVMLLQYPEVKEVEVESVYLDLKDTAATTYTRGQLMTYKWVWERKINKVQPPQEYPMRPSWRCRFCAYSKAAGGPCAK